MSVFRSGKPTIGITMGDAAGIGPEVTLKALANKQLSRRANFLIIGDSRVMEQAGKSCRLVNRFKVIRRADQVDFARFPINMLDLRLLPAGGIKIGRPSAAGGRAVLGYIAKGVGLAKQKKISALVTAPISKEGISQAGLAIQGHTEYLAALTKSRQVAMMLVGGRLKVILVTTHLPLKKVSPALTIPKIYRTIKLADHFLKTHFRISSPRLGVSGLNPHSGEGGRLGREEQLIITPAIKKARRQGIKADGPVPADVLFHQVYHGKFDAAIVMYHDQGLIPLKMLAFEKGVNLTLGLPFIRTSPDHGTAYDIAGKNLANPASMIEAIKLAIRLAAR